MLQVARKVEDSRVQRGAGGSVWSAASWNCTRQREEQESENEREKERERPVVGGDDDDTKSARDDCDGD